MSPSLAIGLFYNFLYLTIVTDAQQCGSQSARSLYVDRMSTFTGWSTSGDVSIVSNRYCADGTSCIQLRGAKGNDASIWKKFPITAGTYRGLWVTFDVHAYGLEGDEACRMYTSLSGGTYTEEQVYNPNDALGHKYAGQMVYVPLADASAAIWVKFTADSHGGALGGDNCYIDEVYVHGCPVTPAPTPRPTPQPTPSPTPYPTPLPTPQPTPQPTPRPTTPTTPTQTPRPTTSVGETNDNGYVYGNADGKAVLVTHRPTTADEAPLSNDDYAAAGFRSGTTETSNSTGTTVLVVGGVVLFIGAFIGLVLLCRKKNKAFEAEDDVPENEMFETNAQAENVVPAD